MKNNAKVTENGQYFNNTPSLSQVYEQYAIATAPGQSIKAQKETAWSAALLKAYLHNTQQTNVPLSGIDTVWALQYHGFLMSRQVGQGLSNQRLWVLVKVLDLAVEKGYINKNPLESLKPKPQRIPRLRQQPPRRIDRVASIQEVAGIFLDSMVSPSNAQ